MAEGKMSKMYEELNRRFRNLIPMSEGVELQLQERIARLYCDVLDSEGSLSPEEFREMELRAERVSDYSCKINLTRVISWGAKKEPYDSKVPAVGLCERLEAGDWAYTVKSMERTPEYFLEKDTVMEYLLKEEVPRKVRKAKGVFVILDFEMENLTKDRVPDWFTDLRLVDDKNRTFGGCNDSDLNGLITFFNPNIPQDYKGVWDIPVDSRGLLLEVPAAPRLEGSSGKLYIDLGDENHVNRRPVNNDKSFWDDLAREK